MMDERSYHTNMDLMKKDKPSISPSIIAIFENKTFNALADNIAALSKRKDLPALREIELFIESYLDKVQEQYQKMASTAVGEEIKPIGKISIDAIPRIIAGKKEKLMRFQWQEIDPETGQRKNGAKMLGEFSLQDDRTIQLRKKHNVVGVLQSDQQDSSIANHSITKYSILYFGAARKPDKELGKKFPISIIRTDDGFEMSFTGKKPEDRAQYDQFCDYMSSGYNHPEHFRTLDGKTVRYGFSTNVPKEDGPNYLDAVLTYRSTGNYVNQGPVKTFDQPKRSR